MKTAIKIAALIGVIALLIALVYSWFTREEWQTRKPCSGCKTLEDGKLQQLVGTITLQSDNEMLFTDTETNTNYKLTPCDKDCDNNLNQWFARIGFADYETKEPLYFKIEGKQDTVKREFLLDNATLVSVQKVKGKLISIEGGSKIQMAQFRILDPFASNLTMNDTITLGYYNYKEQKSAIDTVLLTFVEYDGKTNIKNYYICPDYDGKRGIRPYYIDPEKVRGLPLADIKNTYQPISEEIFPLNENYGEFRGALNVFFTEEQLKQATPIKEVTWEVNDSSMLTIWFVKKQSQWLPLEQYEWKKGTEF